MGYNQHQSFYLRERWLSKALRNLENDSSFFYQKDAFEKIGLGKNMVQSLRHWIRATGIVVENRTDKSHELTQFGKVIKKYDISLKYAGTKALLHYQLVKNMEPSTAWFWYFNIYPESLASKEEILYQFTNWVKANEKRSVSENSLKRDIDTLINMYQYGVKQNDPEEVTISPLSELELVKESKALIIKEEISLSDNVSEFLYFILLDYAKSNDRIELSVDEILNEEALLGKAFNLSRNTLVQLLNNWASQGKYSLEFTRTNNLDTVRVPRIDPLHFLEELYKRKEKVVRR